MSMDKDEELSNQTAAASNAGSVGNPATAGNPAATSATSAVTPEVVVACDFASTAQFREFLPKLGATRPYLKVGMELFYAAGPTLVRNLKAEGFKVFLDLKLHDIPNTVGKAMRVLAELGVDMVNLHAAGGRKMVEAARQALTLPDGSRPTKLLAVTQLTSTSQEMLEEELLIHQPIEEVVTRYAATAQAGGADGVVCSPREAAAVKQHCGSSFLTVTPGIRFVDPAAQATAQTMTAPGGAVQAAMQATAAQIAAGRAAPDDQVRTATPIQARTLGSDYIVVGRPITQAVDPQAAYETCVRQFVHGLE